MSTAGALPPRADWTLRECTNDSLPALHKLVVYHLASYIGPDCDEPFPSVERIAGRLSLSVGKVHELLADLVFWGVLERRGSKGRHSNHYRIVIEQLTHTKPFPPRPTKRQPTPKRDWKAGAMPKCKPEPSSREESNPIRVTRVEPSSREETKGTGEEENKEEELLSQERQNSLTKPQRDHIAFRSGATTTEAQQITQSEANMPATPKHDQIMESGSLRSPEPPAAALASPSPEPEPQAPSTQPSREPTAPQPHSTAAPSEGGVVREEKCPVPGVPSLLQTPKPVRNRKLGLWLDDEDDYEAPEIPEGETITEVMLPKNQRLGEWLSDRLLVSSRPQYTPSTPIKGVPPYPSFIRIPQVPAPPRLQRSMSGFTLAITCAAGYESAASHFFKRSVRLRGRGDTAPFAKHKHYDLLEQAGRYLLEHAISPWSWAGFSCKDWLGMQQHGSASTKYPAPVSWVFNAERLVKHQERFREVESSYSGGTLRFPPSLRKLLSDYLAMREEINRGPGNSTDIAARHFPRWDQRIARVEADCDAERIAIQKEIGRGVWFWQ